MRNDRVALVLVVILLALGVGAVALVVFALVAYGWPR